MMGRRRRRSIGRWDEDGWEGRERIRKEEGVGQDRGGIE